MDILKKRAQYPCNELRWRTILLLMINNLFTCISLQIHCQSSPYIIHLGISKDSSRIVNNILIKSTAKFDPFVVNVLCVLIPRTMVVVEAYRYLTFKFLILFTNPTTVSKGSISRRGIERMAVVCNCLHTSCSYERACS